MAVFNSRYLLKYRHVVKIVCVVVAWIFGFGVFFFAYLLVGKQNTLGFVMSLVATLIIGGFTSVGSTTIVGFLKAFEADSISGFSSGTGLAGISGSSLYLLFSSIGLTFNIIVLMLVPAALLYLMIFKIILDMKANIDRRVKARMIGSMSIEDQAVDAEGMKEEGEQAEADINQPMTVENAVAVMKVVGWPLFNLSAVSELLSQRFIFLNMLVPRVSQREQTQRKLR